MSQFKKERKKELNNYVFQLMPIGPELHMQVQLIHLCRGNS